MLKEAFLINYCFIEAGKHPRAQSLDSPSDLQDISPNAGFENL